MHYVSTGNLASTRLAPWLNGPLGSSLIVQGLTLMLPDCRCVSGHTLCNTLLLWDASSVSTSARFHGNKCMAMNLRASPFPWG
eukprot:6078268-Lingulodinium_polyedra.AAC.1